MHEQRCERYSCMSAEAAGVAASTRCLGGGWLTMCWEAVLCFSQG